MIHEHATHIHVTFDTAHHHGPDTMVTRSRPQEAHHHCDDKCIAALEAYVAELKQHVDWLVDLLEDECWRCTAGMPLVYSTGTGGWRVEHVSEFGRLNCFSRLVSRNHIAMARQALERDEGVRG